VQGNMVKENMVEGNMAAACMVEGHTVGAKSIFSAKSIISASFDAILRHLELS
jgi:hypothetical protein